MVYPKSGFLWDNAQAHGLSAHVWGEYAEFWNGPDKTPCPGTWTDWYKDSQILEGKATGTPHVPVGYCQTTADVPSLDKILSATSRTSRRTSPTSTARTCSSVTSRRTRRTAGCRR